MKTILEYTTRHTRAQFGTPDKIKYNNEKVYTYENKHAYPFILNLVQNDVIWGEASKSHNDILFSLSDKEQKKYELDDVMFVDELDSGKLEIDNKCGRIWVIPITTSKNRNYDVYIAWWNKLNEQDLLKYSKQIVKSFNKKFNYKLNSYMIVNSEGDFMLIDPEEHTIKIKYNDKERKQDVEKLRNIHLANQSEKRKYFSAFRAKRNDKMQKTLWNSTKSKTAAEYNNIKTIGDSLDNNIYTHNMKSLLEYILEKKSITFNGTGSKNTNYGQCIILAGGPGSGKGFIQNKILCNFKVVDVDNLKKMYMKMVKLGKIKDDKDYNLADPKDVSILHQRVKEHGWKNLQRELFWGQRELNDEHSSGLNPNILFDMVSDDPKDIFDVAVKAKAMGYNVTLIWVLCNKEVAKIGNEIRDRRVGEEVIDNGHDGAYTTITKVFNNEYPYISELIDRAWIGFSAGYGRKLSEVYSKDPVLKVKNTIEDKFSIDKGKIDKFLKQKMPINYTFINKRLNSSDDKEAEQAKKWIKIVGSEYQPDTVKESFENDYSEDEYINAWKTALQEIL